MPRRQAVSDIRLPARLCLIGWVVVVAGAAGACSGGVAGEGDATAGATRTVVHERGETVVPAEPQRLVVLGEEFLLADVLALGVTPVASTATLGSAGFAGLDDDDLSDVQPLSSTEPNLEFLATLDPDLILAPGFVLDTVGGAELSGIAPTVPVPESDWRESVEFVGYALDREDEVGELLERYDAAVDAGSRTLASAGVSQVSLATIYPGPQVAVWVGGPSNLPQTALDLGLELVPDEDRLGATGAAQGRAYISLEQVNLLQAPELVMLQSPGVEGEQSAYDEVSTGGLFAALPAVRSGDVHVLDRLAYPGVEGRTRLVADYVSALTD